MIKHILSVPTLAFVMVLVVRGLSAQPSSEQAAIAQQAGETTVDESVTPYLELARNVYRTEVRAAINARAVEIFNKAQQSGEAIAFTSNLCQKTAQDLSDLRQQYGVVTGEASQWGVLINRVSELSACSLAHNWVMNGGVASDATSVNPAIALSQFSEVFGHGQ